MADDGSDMEQAARAESRAALGALVGQATRVIGLDGLRGVALYDSEKDAAITSLEGFEEAAGLIRAIPLVAERYGVENATRLALQFVYESGARLTEATFDDAVVGDAWQAFCEELDAPTWVFRGVANVRNFQGDEQRFDLADGVASEVARSMIWRHLGSVTSSWNGSRRIGAGSAQARMWWSLKAPSRSRLTTSSTLATGLSQPRPFEPWERSAFLGQEM